MSASEKKNGERLGSTYQGRGGSRCIGHGRREHRPARLWSGILVARSAVGLAGIDCGAPRVDFRIGIYVVDPQIFADRRMDSAQLSRRDGSKARAAVVAPGTGRVHDAGSTRVTADVAATQRHARSVMGNRHQLTDPPSAASRVTSCTEPDGLASWTRRVKVWNPVLDDGLSRSTSEEAAMKSTIIVLAVTLAVSGTNAGAQGGAPSGRGSMIGDPAASSATPGTSPTTGSAMKPSRSGSGTSTSGGSDANGDQGRDTMPGSNKSVKPLDEQHKPGKMP